MRCWEKSGDLNEPLRYIFTTGLIVIEVSVVLQKGCDKGQTTFEYLLLVGGAVILAVLVIYMLTSGVQESARDVNETINEIVSRFAKVAEEYIRYLERTIR